MTENFPKLILNTNSSIKINIRHQTTDPGSSENKHQAGWMQIITTTNTTPLCVHALCVRLVAQWCLTLWDPMDCSLPGFSVHGILQARILECVAIPIKLQKIKDKEKFLKEAFFFLCFAQWLQSCPLFATLWAVAHQVSLSMEFSKHEYWNGLPCPPSGDLP